MLGNYQQFKFGTSLIGEIYSTTDSSRMMHGAEPEDEDGAIEDLHKSLDTHAKYKYSYQEYLFTWLMKRLCCCCKKAAFYKRRLKRYQRH